MSQTSRLLEKIYQDNFEPPLTENIYIYLTGSSYDYYYRPNSESYQPIKTRLDSSGRLGRITSRVLKVTVRAPSSTKVLPRVRQESLNVPQNHLFDAAIVGTRTKTIHLDKEIVYTFSGSKTTNILNEVDIRQNLPDSIHVPKILDVDRGYPYFAEEYIDGKTLTHPVKQADRLFEALEELRPLYEQRCRSWRDTLDILSEIYQKLDERDDIDSKLMGQAYNAVKEYELPDKLAVGQVHGDFHPGNILVCDGTVYLLDWESSEQDLLISDFFRPFEVLYGINNSKVIREMTHCQGDGAALATRYAKQFGPITFGDSRWQSGLPILYLLNRLVGVESENIQKHRSYRLLNELV